MIREIARKRPCTEKFLRWLLPRGLLVVLGLAVCIVVVASAPRVETGNVEYKLVTGKNDEIVHVLLVNMDRRNIVVSERMREIIRADYGQMLVSMALENEMSKYYTGIQYKVILKRSGLSTMKSYVVPREVFNAAETNTMVKFETQGLLSNKVTRMVTDDNKVLIIDTNDLTVRDVRQYMYH
jgi:hypothetical protein